MHAKIEKLESIIKKIPDIFVNGTKNAPGDQDIIDINIREGSLLLGLIFTSRHYYDEQGLRKTIKNAFENNRIGEWDLILSDFSFQALNNPAPPESVKAIKKDNSVTVTWKKPQATFFKTELYIVQVNTKHRSSTHANDYEVPVDKMSYSVVDVLPSTTIEFTVYTGICHSIRSYASDMICIFVEGPTPPQDVKATNKGSDVEISWKKPIHPISKFIQHFRITALESKTKVEALVSGSEYVYLLPSCKPMTNYSFQLSTLTSNELESQTSEKIEIQTEGPSPPRNVNVTCKGTDIELSWTKPVHPILKFVKKFKIQITNSILTYDQFVNGSEFVFKLSNCIPVTNFSFQLTTLTTNEIESQSTEAITIQTQKASVYAPAQVHKEKNRLALTSTFNLRRPYSAEDVKVLQKGRLVICDSYVKQLITCTVNGKQMNTIVVNGYPLCIAVIDDWNVAVSLMTLDHVGNLLRHFEITLVDIKELCVKRNVGRFPCMISSCLVTFGNNKLFVHATSGEIEVMDMFGRMKDKILFSNSSLILSDMSYIEKSDLICGMSLEGENIISINGNGICTTIYEYKDYLLFDRQLAIDIEGNYIVFCCRKKFKSSYKVYEISRDLKSCDQLLSSKVDTFEAQTRFCMRYSFKPMIVIIQRDKIHVYSDTSFKES
ncbi:uncharacterized protein LOC127704473 [Mytilus californianus]|uniref:uncharacterized protein LOC127704473 n=1 Tax=Mytilus californianus TaxID=6549 RepID=UPI002246046F|nr:uncharacterized protein LOC127704473 [Mytilus californianus]